MFLKNYKAIVIYKNLENKLLLIFINFNLKKNTMFSSGYISFGTGILVGPRSPIANPRVGKCSEDECMNFSSFTSWAPTSYKVVGLWLHFFQGEEKPIYGCPFIPGHFWGYIPVIPLEITSKGPPL